MTLAKASRAAEESRSTRELDLIKTSSSYSSSDKHRIVKIGYGERDRRDEPKMMIHSSDLCGYPSSHCRRHSSVLESSDSDCDFTRFLRSLTNKWKARGDPVLRTGTTDPVT